MLLAWAVGMMAQRKCASIVCALVSISSIARHRRRHGEGNQRGDNADTQGYAKAWGGAGGDGHSRSEEHTSELQSLMRISYAVFCLKKKKIRHIYTNRSSSEDISTTEAQTDIH